MRLGLSSCVGIQWGMRVGAFELKQEIGAGGMGVIWRANHVDQGVPAAVKFDLQATDPHRQEAFAAEVRRIAELDHPNVVHLFDTGIVTAEDATQGLPEHVHVGTPWLAMELARAGSVEDWQPTTWEEVEHVAVGLLRGLATAHAHGIVHRDIKAANLLLAGARSSLVSAPESLMAARVVLSDFGIGHDVDRPGTMDDKSVGTPRFMTPEQIEADWRNQGPWTDLYQTGVLLWRLAAGTYPFDGSRPIQLYRAHLFSQPPRFEPCMAVPEGLEALLRHLLEKDVRKRPQLAADVLAALAALGPPVVEAAAVPVAVDPDAPTEFGDTSNRDTAYLHRSSGVVLDQGLRGAGLGLWGLRPLPLVGREEPQRVLDAVLREVIVHHSPRAQVILGPEGVGKTRLAMDLCRSAHERGDALFMVARHGESPDPDHGLRGMMRRQLRLAGLEREDAEARIEAQVGVRDPGSLQLFKTWLLGPASGNDREPSIRERFAILANVLEAWARLRPRIVLLDDVEYGSESIRFVRWVVGQPDFPVLFVLTAGETGLAQRSTERALLDTLFEEPTARVLPLEPLSDSDHRSLVRKMLGLEGRLAVEVERRTSGNPAFAVQLVNSWVESGRLVLGRDGFKFRGDLDQLPSDLLEVYAGQVRSLLKKLAPDERRALQIVALLGEEVKVKEWQGVCARAGITLRRALVALLVQLQVIRADSSLEQVHFRHNGLREALLAQLRRQGVEAELAVFCVAELESREDDGERLARLLLAAGRQEEAVGPLQRAIEEQLEEDSRSPRLLEALTKVLEATAPADDARWGMLWLNWAWLHRAQGNHEKADRLSAKAELLARRHDWKAVLGWALREAGSTAISRAEYADALEYLREAEGLLLASGWPASAADCRTKIGVVHENLGEYAKAKEVYRTCLEAFEAEPRAWTLAASPWIQLAQIAQKEGHLAEALDLAEEARWRAQRVSQTNSLAHIALLEGEVARALGDLELASERYNESHELFDAFRDPTATVAMLNLGVVGVLRQDYEETRARMQALLGRLTRSEDAQPIFLAYARSVLLPCCAALGDQPGFLAHATPLLAFLEQSGVADPDILKLARTAASSAKVPPMRALAERIVALQESRLG